MKKLMSGTVVSISVGLALLLVLGGVALAMRPAAPGDFSPFTMRVTRWVAAAMQRQGELPIPGTAVSVLEYRNIDSWKLTVVSSTWDPAVVGTSIEVNNGSQSTFISQARKLVSRVIPLQEQGRQVPFRWVTPGLIDDIVRQGFVPTVTASPGGVTFIETNARTTTKPDGSLQVVDGTFVVFDAATRLPKDMSRYRSGALLESEHYEVVSRP